MTTAIALGKLPVFPSTIRSFEHASSLTGSSLLAASAGATRAAEKRPAETDRCRLGDRNSTKYKMRNQISENPSNFQDSVVSDELPPPLQQQ